jgi:CTP synthase (UTP-ammonia lyase)
VRPIRVALVGDFSQEVTAHKAINECFRLAKKSQPMEPSWIRTDTIIPGDESQLAPFQGIWCVPASPYLSTEGALWAIQYARTYQVPFLGTCGGYQHALLEFARNILNLKKAGHTELDSSTKMPLLDRMQCPLVEKAQTVLVTDPEFSRLYGAGSGLEKFHCRYGLNAEFEHLFTPTPLRIAARSEDGQARAFMLAEHLFFVGTQFQPERLALANSIHPLVSSFFGACISAAAPGVSRKSV